VPTLLEITRIKLTIQNKKVNKSNKMPPKFAITDLQNFARNRNSHLLSEKYTTAATKYRWQCPNGHIFERTWAEARNCSDERWCQECKKSGKIELLRAYAQERGGKCLSK